MDAELTALGREAARVGIDAVAEEVYSEMRVSAEEVRAAAQAVVDFSNELEKKWREAQALTKAVGNNTDPTSVINRFNRKMVQSKADFIQLMDCVLKLQNIINEFLGQRVQMIFTYIGKNGEVELYKVNNDIEHLTIDQASKSHGGAFTGRYKYSKKALSNMSRFSNLNYNSQSLDETFQEVYQRAKISKSLFSHMRGAFYIMWREHGEWEKAFVTGMGAVAESYFKFYINEYTFASFIEAAVGDYVMHPEYGVIAGDSTSGFLEGDFSKDGIEYGLKAKGATALGYADIVEYAREMVAAPDLLTYLTGLNGSGGLKQKLEEEGAQNLAQKVAVNMDSEEDRLLIETLQKRANINLTFH